MNVSGDFKAYLKKYDFYDWFFLVAGIIIWLLICGIVVSAVAKEGEIGGLIASTCIAGPASVGLILLRFETSKEWFWGSIIIDAFLLASGALGFILIKLLMAI